MGTKQQHDFDYIVIGSGFGGSVSALRLAQKGYRVAVLEKGKEWKTQDFLRPIGILENIYGFRFLDVMDIRCLPCLNMS